MAEDIRKMKNTDNVNEFHQKYNKPHCIALDSEYCSMGRMIGILACNEAGYTYHDSLTLLKLVDSDISMDKVKEFETRLRKQELSKEELINNPDYNQIYALYSKAIDIALKNGPCLIHDRASKQMILDKGYTCISVLTYALDLNSKIVRAKYSPLYEDINDNQELIKMIQEEDMVRINYHKAHNETTWGDKEAYDLCINTDAFGREFAAQLLSMIMK